MIKDSGLYKYYAGLPPWARAVILIAIVGITIIIIMWIRKAIKDANEKGNREQEFLKDYDKFCKTKTGSNMSFPATSYLQMADKIYGAGCWGVFCAGTDFDTIRGIFSQLNTTCDAILLVQAFGKRFERGTVCVTPWNNCEDDKLELGGWLSTELSSSETAELNSIMKSKNIAFSI